MSKWKAGTLQSGSGGKIKSQKQAVAVMLSEKRKAAAGNTEYQSSQDSAGRSGYRPITASGRLKNMLTQKAAQKQQKATNPDMGSS